ncbi:hypothetical protein MRB53_005390 [Persea americana]|uniref:Uncharacterized protein n=1 Tax=Persea americana TaxID=3435 RepID=A0ACC2MD90_PERAE|nr:hypothetical protein MRB53_005390 [Persea americana]
MAQRQTMETADTLLRRMARKIGETCKKALAFFLGNKYGFVFSGETPLIGHTCPTTGQSSSSGPLLWLQNPDPVRFYNDLREPSTDQN